MEKILVEFTKWLTVIVSKYFDVNRPRWQRIILFPFIVTLLNFGCIFYALIPQVKKEQQ